MSLCPVSHVICLFQEMSMSLGPMSPVDLKKCLCHYIPCRLLILRNVHVTKFPCLMSLGLMTHVDFNKSSCPKWLRYVSHVICWFLEMSMLLGPISPVDFKKYHCPMSIDPVSHVIRRIQPMSMSLGPLSPVYFKKYPCPMSLDPVSHVICRFSRNVHVTRPHVHCGF